MNSKKLVSGGSGMLRSPRGLILAFAAVIAVGGASLAHGQPEKAPPPPPAPSAPPGATQPATPPAHPAPEATPSAAAQPLEYVKLKTSMGDIFLELDREHAPISVENFLMYVNKGHYDGTIFHRVMDGFMIQGGGFTADMKEKSNDKPIKNEWKNGLKNKSGTIAMARLGGRADSATSQFFINVKDNKFLDDPNDGAGYAVFGKVVSGMDVVNKIKGVKTATKGGHEAVPVTAVTIEKATKVTKEEAMPEKK